MTKKSSFHRLFSGEKREVNRAEQTPKRHILTLFRGLHLSVLLYKIGMKSHRPEDYGNHSSKEESFMERTYTPLIRQFSSIKGYQAAYTLVYALDASEGGCHLTLARKGEREQQVSEPVPLHPEGGYRLLQHLCDRRLAPGAGSRAERRCRRCPVSGMRRTCASL